MFLRSFVDFDGLAADEILARLFAWWFGPSFVAFFASFIATRSGSFIDASSAATYAGIVLTGLVVLRDGGRAGVVRPWLWALITAFIPLFGWWAYGRVRAPDVATRIGEYRGRPSTLARSSIRSGRSGSRCSRIAPGKSALRA